jgi:hypothetical protein
MNLNFLKGYICPICAGKYPDKPPHVFSNLHNYRRHTKRCSKLGFIKFSNRPPPQTKEEKKAIREEKRRILQLERFEAEYPSNDEIAEDYQKRGSRPFQL